MAQAFDNLELASWRGIEFPTISPGLNFRHGMAVHQVIDRDGGFPEPTGRGPRMVRIQIPFLEGLRGYDDPPLYPDRYDLFERAFEDKSQGTLVHPKRGAMQVFPDTFETALDPDKRNGQIVTASWVETNDAPLEDVVSIRRSAASFRTTAQALDAGITTLPAGQQPNIQAEGFTSFDDFAAKLQGVQRNADFQRAQAARKADRIIGLARTVKAATSPANAPLLDTVERFTQATRETRDAVIALLRPTRFQRVGADSTIAYLAQIYQNTADDLLALNPQIRGLQSLRAGAVIKVYR